MMGFNDYSEFFKLVIFTFFEVFLSNLEEVKRMSVMKSYTFFSEYQQFMKKRHTVFDSKISFKICSCNIQEFLKCERTFFRISTKHEKMFLLIITISICFHVSSVS